jgi:hypothetical protein
MRVWVHVLSLFAALCLLACTPATSPAPTPVPGAVEGDLATQGFVQSADAKLRVGGRANLRVSIASLPNPPSAPPGWILVTPVFNVLAHDRQNRVVVRLPDPVSLRFDVPANRPMTVLVHDGTRWEIVPSEVDGEGRLVAQVEHLTPYAAGQPVGTAATASPSPATPRPAGASPVTTQPLATGSAPAPNAAGSPVPGASELTRPPGGGSPVVTISPVAPVTAPPAINVTTVATQVPTTSAEAVLKVAIEPLKGRTVRVTSAGGYTGNLSVAIPPALQTALNGALSAAGAGYYGLYQTINEAVTIQGSGSGNSILTLLVEPRTSMPANSAEALSQLKAAFPGVTTSLTEASSTTGSYLYTGNNDTTSYALGFVSYQNVPLAYVMAGSGNYAASVPRS